MKETLICKLNKHCIYYVSDNSIGFYILVPFKDYNETNISIRLKSNYEMYDLNKNDINLVQEELLNYYKDIDNYNITLIMPIFFDDILNRTRAVNDIELFNKIDNYLGKIFNGAFALLTKNNIKVNSNIYFINNDSFKSFTNWYVNRYNNRIEYKTVMDLVKENGSYRSYDVLETPSMNFVIGKEEEPKIDKTIEIEVETFDNMINEIKEEKNIKTNKKAISNEGYVSYIFLGVISFILSLCLLYLFVK